MLQNENILTHNASVRTGLYGCDVEKTPV